MNNRNLGNKYFIKNFHVKRTITAAICTIRAFIGNMKTRKIILKISRNYH